MGVLHSGRATARLFAAEHEGRFRVSAQSKNSRFAGPCAVTVLSLCACLFPLRVVGQQESGSISGLVLDPSQSVIVGAQVLLTNESTSATFTTNSDGQGLYRVPQVVPGVYTLTVNASGFTTSERRGLTVRVNDRLRLDVVLQVGSVGERIVVEGGAPLLQAEDAATGQVIDNQKITELPLNGRNWLQLATLAPATVSYPTVTNGDTGNIQSVVMNLGGTRTNQNNYLLDGADNSAFVGGTAVAYPPVDSLQEFKVQTNNYTADIGQSAGAVINATIKSGSNRIHGSAYEFVRNRSFNARNFFASPTARSPQFNRNQFGASIGGAFVPDKLFYFLNYEGIRQRQDQVLTRQVFTDAQKSGNFASQLGARVGTDALGNPVHSGQIFDPYSVQRLADGRAVRQAFPGNIIPASRIHPISKSLIDLAPAPNASGSPNFVTNVGRPVNVDTFVGRVDYIRSEKNTLFGHIIYADQDSHSRSILGSPLDGQTSLLQTSDQRTGQIGWSHIFRPTDLNEFRVGYVRNVTLQRSELADQAVNEQFGLPFPTLSTNTGGLAPISIAGFTSLGTGGTWFQYMDKYELSDGYTAIRGNHTLKLGFRAALKVFYNQTNCSQCKGSFSFNGVFSRQVGFNNTGSSVADFLIGTPDSSALRNLTNEKDLGHTFEWYLQDRWAVNRKLTLTLGLRYTYNPPTWETRGRVSSVLFNDNFTTAEIVVPHDQGDETFAQMQLLFPDFQVRRALELDRGLVHNPLLNFAPRLGAAYQVNPKTVIRGGYGIFYGFIDVVSGSIISLNPPSRVILSDSTNTVDPTLSIDRSPFGDDPFNRALVNPGYNNVRDPDLRADLTQMYNLTVQREFGNSWLLEVGYMGNYSPRLAVVTQVNDSVPALPADTSSPQSRRRVSPLLGNLPYMSSQGHSSYNAFILALEKRMSNGLSLLANYTWARALGAAPPITLGINDTPVQNPFDLGQEYGPLEFDIVNRASFGYVYDLPFGTGRRFLSNSPGIVKALLGGWQVNGITTLQGGFPYTPVLSYSLGKTFTSSRPNAIGDPTKTSRQPHDWVSPAAFAIPSDSEIAAGNFYGNTGRNSVRQPGLVNFDFSLMKNFEIREQMRLQFRSEFFNIMNTPYFGVPGSIGTVFGTPTFGRVTRAGDPRVIQFGARLTF
jgi:hypothetical protein